MDNLDEYKGIDEETFQRLKNDKYTMFYSYIMKDGVDYQILKYEKGVYTCKNSEGQVFEFNKSDPSIEKVNKFIKGTFWKKAFRIQGHHLFILVFALLLTYSYVHDINAMKNTIIDMCNDMKLQGIDTKNYEACNYFDNLNASKENQIPVFNSNYTSNLTF